MTRLDEYAQEKMRQSEQRGLRRTLSVVETGPGQRIMRGGRPLTAFCSNDYLGLAHHREVIAAGQAAMADAGAGAGASRLISGTYPGVIALEDTIARYKGSEAALVFGSGYLANLGVIPALAGKGDLVVCDALAHACLRSGALLSGAHVLLFEHNDMADLARLLNVHRSKARHCLVVTEGVFSMDGDMAPLPALKELCTRQDAWLMVDDAHGLGVIGGGRGSAAHWGVQPDLTTGTLSKALGSYGGYVTASRAVIDLLVTRARSFVFATALPPVAAAAAHRALEILEGDPSLSARVCGLARDFCHRVGLAPTETAIVPWILGSPEAAIDASRALDAEGFLVTAIRPPTVPEGTSRLRFTFSADHLAGDVARLAEIVRALRATREAA